MISQVERLIEDIQQHHKIIVKDFLGLYSEGRSREYIAEALGLTKWNVRAIMNLLNLRSPKKHRINDLQRFEERFSSPTRELSGLTEELREHQEDLHYLAKTLETKDKSIISLRAQLKASRLTARSSSIEDNIKETIREVISSLPDSIKATSIPKEDISHVDGTFMITLSDLHFDELVRASDTTKSFNWEVAKKRLSDYFRLALGKSRGERRLVVCMLGDLLSGTIHGAQESASKPIVEATSELAVLLTEQVAAISKFFESTEVYCVNGNHERISEKPSSYAKGYDYSYFLYSFMKASLSSDPTISVIISTNGYNVIPLGNDRHLLAHHGDIHREAISLSRTLKIKETVKQVFGVDINVQLQGHLHQLDVRYFGETLHISCPSFIGVGNYSHTNGFLGTPASQIVLRWDSEGQLEALHNIILGDTNV